MWHCQNNLDNKEKLRSGVAMSDRKKHFPDEGLRHQKFEMF